MTIKINNPIVGFAEFININSELLDAGVKERFLDRLTAMEMRMNGCKAAEISSKTGVSASEVTRLFKRFISIDSQGRFYGDRALVPNSNIVGYTRTAIYHGKRTQQQGALSGILGMTLRAHPGIQEVFVSELLKFHTKYKKSII
jgi:hypothetical protein